MICNHCGVEFSERKYEEHVIDVLVEHSDSLPDIPHSEEDEDL